MFNFTGKVVVAENTTFYKIQKGGKYEINPLFENGYRFEAKEIKNNWTNYFKIKISESVFKKIKEHFFNDEKIDNENTNFILKKEISFDVKDGNFVFMLKKDIDNKIRNHLYISIEKDYLISFK